MSTSIRPASKSYWVLSRSHRYTLLFALPLLLLYELLEAVAPIQASGGVIRNGADVILTGAFIWVFGARGPLVFMSLVIGISLFLFWRDRNSGRIQTSVLARMAGESVLLAMAFGFVVSMATMQLIGPFHSLAAPGITDSPLSALTLSLGAGLYEELLFRVILVSALVHGMHLMGFSRVVSAVLATVIGALLFSAFHYIGPLGEPLKLESFVFRALAGVAFSALYLTRGFGITAWTHAIYDVFILM